MSGKFWTVWNENGRVPIHQHGCLSSAQTEAERLARNNPGDKFYIFEALEMRVVDNMTRIRLGDNDDDIPF